MFNLQILIKYEKEKLQESESKFNTLNKLEDKEDLIFKAIYEETDKLHTITFDALDGKFTNGESTYTVTGKYKTDVSYVKPENYTNEKGTFTFICWTTIPYSLDDKADLVISNEDVTYYAYYSLSPATISLKEK